jgi:hypothetical protein
MAGRSRPIWDIRVEPVDGAFQTSPADHSHFARANQSRELPPLAMYQTARDETDVVEPDKVIRIEMMRDAMDRETLDRPRTDVSSSGSVTARPASSSWGMSEREGVEDLPVHVDRM